MGIARRMPLKRSRKPLKRTKLSRKPGRRAKEVKSAIESAKATFFDSGRWHDEHSKCQWCQSHITKDNAVAHHKIKRSLKIDDTPENFVIVHHWPCHASFHTGDKEGTKNLKMVRESTANVINAEAIS